ncbi:hypothetical protein ACFQGT_00460 [Natrialbaceae archaeon GCM10025810]
MDAGIIFAVTFAVLGTVALYSRRGDQIERTYHTIEYFRGVIGATALVLISWTFLRSGSMYLFVVAIGLIVFATVYVLVEQPHRNLV